MTDARMTDDPERPNLAVSVDAETHVATIEILRGPHNYFDLDVMAGIADALVDLAAADTRAVVLCSEGKNFCAGADFSGRDGKLRGEGAPHIYDVAIRLFEQPLPIVAAVQGAAIGGGLGLALAADFRVASESSRFAANFALLGFHHGFGLGVTLPLVVGHQAALDLLYTGRRIRGDEALRLGLCDRLVADDAIRSSALALAGEIAAAAPLATRSIRATMRGHLAGEVRAAMAHERAEQERLQATDDFREGIRATAQRETPTFTGR